MKLTPAEIDWLALIQRMTLEAHGFSPRRCVAKIRRDHLRRLRVLGRRP